MPRTLETCLGCSRHIRSTEPHCPFCARPRVNLKAAGSLAASVALGLSLAACYGRPPPPGGWGPPPTPAAPSASESADPAPSSIGPPPATPVGPPPPPPSKKAKGR